MTAARELAERMLVELGNTGLIESGECQDDPWMAGGSLIRDEAQLVLKLAQGQHPVRVQVWDCRADLSLLTVDGEAFSFDPKDAIEVVQHYAALLKLRGNAHGGGAL